MGRLISLLLGASKNEDFRGRARKHRAQNRSVYDIHEDSSTGLTQLSCAKTIFRGALLCVMFALPVSAQTIKKCQDAEGKWHYGDHAALECGQTGRITEIDEDGDTVGEVEAPPTQEELDAKMRAEEQASEQEEAEDALKRLDQRLLITYDSSESIMLTRDALLAAIDSATEADQILRDRLTDDLKKLEANGDEADAGSVASLKQQIEDFNEAIRNRLAKREIAKSKYDMEYNRYKGLTGN